jgi:uncharacterized protein YkwD
MRKPLVVLGVAATAMVAGGAVTTAAMAQEPPDEFAGLTIFGVPLMSDGDDGGEPPIGDDDMPDLPDEPESPVVTAGAPRQPGPRPVVTGASSGAPTVTAASSDAPAVTGASSGVEDPSARPPVIRLRAVARKQNHGLAAAADPIVASHTAVTADSISASPAAPVQQQILALVNRFRAKSGCAPVTVDRRLVDAANRHAADMVRRDYFDHASPEGDRAGERVSGAGYQWRWYGENIARGQESPWEAMDGWMNSPEHRSNILDCKLDQMGVGLAIDRDHTPYWVQDFATPK